MKKFLLGKLMLVIFTGTIATNCLTAQTAAAPTIGDGTAGSPYHIATWQNLYWISQNSGQWDKHFIQTADIDFPDDINTWNSGAGFMGIGDGGVQFTGSYDGGGHKITGLFINRPQYFWNIGFFGMTIGATIKNLGLEDVDISGSSYVGGVVGNALSSTISQVYSTGTVNGSGYYVGGLAGYSEQGCTISDSYSGASIQGTGDFFGGLIGHPFIDDEISNCFAYGSVADAATKEGGLFAQSYGTDVNCFWDVTTSGQAASGGGTGKTTGEMKTLATFTDVSTVGLTTAWDFVGTPNDDSGTDDIWKIDGVNNDGYPYLSWQNFGSNYIFVKADAPGSNDGASWENAFVLLQSALDIAVSGDQIWVAAGTYTPTLEVGGSGDRFKSFQMKSGVEIYGGFAGTEDPENFDIANRDFEANETILSGDLLGNDSFDHQNGGYQSGTGSDNSYHVVANPATAAIDATAVLDGFTISGGNANVEGFGETSAGGGIANEGASPTLNNLLIRHNAAYFAGGGMLNTDASMPIIANVRIIENVAFFQGAGMVNNANSDVQFTNGLVADNVVGLDDGGGGGFVNAFSNPTFTNLTISNNTAGSGGGVAESLSNSTYNNSIISGNMATNDGHEFYLQDASITLNNSAYSNQAGDIFLVDANSTTTFNNSITDDPQFVDPANGDYRITGSSPCVDSGNDSYNDLETDIRGTGFARKLDKNNHTQAGTIDIGAYEYKQGTDPAANCINPTSGGTIAATTISVCSGDVPGIISNTLSPSGHTGTLEYKWQMSTVTPITTWDDIANSDSEDYQPGALTQTTWFRRLARSCTDNWSSAAISNIAEIHVPVMPAAEEPHLISGVYQIATFENLLWISENSTSWGGEFLQTANIDASLTQDECFNGGQGWSPIGNNTTKFTGTYDGGGYTINELFTDNTTWQYSGFFGQTSNAIIKNVGLTDIEVSGTKAGALVAWSRGTNNRIENCYAIGSVTGRDEAGGLVGILDGEMSLSWFHGTVYCSHFNAGGLVSYLGYTNPGKIYRSYSNAQVTGQSYVGGIVGFFYLGIIQDTYSLGSVEAMEPPAGGLVGGIYEDVLVNRCYSSAEVIGTGDHIGGLIGEDWGGNVQNSFWNKDASGQDESAGGTGLNNDEMKMRSTFTNANWDFPCETANGTGDIWGINDTDNDAYPFLMWQGFENKDDVMVGKVSGDQVICYDTQPDDIVLSDANGLVQWQWSVQNISNTFTDIVGTASTTLSGDDIGTLTKTTYFRALVGEQECQVISEVVEVVVYNKFTPGEIETTGETICYNTAASVIGSETAAGGGHGAIEYTWRSSVDNFATITLIDGAASESYTPGTLTQTTSYRRYAKDGECNTTPVQSAGEWTVTVHPQFTAGKIETDGEIICFGGTPAQIGSTTDATGGFGVISYTWRSSVDDFDAAIAGATAATFTPPAGLTATTGYRRYATNTDCNTTPLESIGTWTVTVREELTISCPNDFDVSADPGVCTASVTFSAIVEGTPAPVVTYKVGDLEITSPHNFPTGATTVVVTAENSCGLLTCSFTVTVTDNQYPTIENLPDNITKTNDEGICGAEVTWTEPISADNCEGHSIQQIEGDPSGSFFSVGTHTIAYEVTDASGNKGSDSFTITITDDESPQITCPDDVTISCEDSSHPDAIGTATATDNCDTNPEITYSDEITPGACTNTYTIIRTWKATDRNDNVSTCTQTITVRDITKPTVKTKTITIELDEDGNASIAHDAVDNGSTDNCPGTLTFSTDKTEFTCADLGDNQVILTVTDACGNAASATATVKVVDLIKPVVKCKPIEVFLDASGNVSINPADVDDSSADNCGTITITVTPSHFTCDDVGENEVVLTATDGSGNSASCTTTVTVTDNVKPIVKTQNITVTLDNTGNAVITPDQINNGSSDNCGIATMTLDHTEFSCADMGKTITVTLTVTDVNGNEESGQATVTVNELSVPVTRVNIRAESYAGGQVKFIANPINGGDNPTYQWYKNGLPINGATDNILISTCKSGDEHYVELTSSIPCTAVAISNAMCTY